MRGTSPGRENTMAKKCFRRTWILQAFNFRNFVINLGSFMRKTISVQKKKKKKGGKDTSEIAFSCAFWSRLVLVRLCAKHSLFLVFDETCCTGVCWCHLWMSVLLWVNLCFNGVIGYSWLHCFDHWLNNHLHLGELVVGRGGRLAWFYQFSSVDWCTVKSLSSKITLVVSSQVLLNFFLAWWHRS